MRSGPTMMLGACLLLQVVLFVILVTRQTAAEEGNHRVIVQLKSQTIFRSSTLDSVETKVQEWNIPNGLVERTFRSVLRGMVVTNLTEADVQRIALDDDVLHVEPDLLITVPPTEPNAPYQILSIPESTTVSVDAAQFVQSENLFNWGLDRIDATRGLNDEYRYSYTGKNVDIYIADTGIFADHVDFSDRVSTTDCFSAYPSEGCTDYVGHGTHVAGTAAGLYSGVAKQANIITVKVFDQNGRGFISDSLAGLDWITTRRARQPSPKRPAVINMSLGASFSSSYNAAVKSVIDSGVVVVASAGNDFASSACSKSPSSTLDALTVASTTDTDVRSDFSNVGTCVDIFAPGSDIYSSDFQDPSLVVLMSGTSMAAPHVAGVAALYLERNPLLSPAQVRTIMMDDALQNAILDTRNSPNRFLYTGNLIDQANAPIPTTLFPTFSPTRLPTLLPKTNKPTIMTRAFPSPAPIATPVAAPPTPTPPTPTSPTLPTRGPTDSVPVDPVVPFGPCQGEPICQGVLGLGSPLSLSNTVGCLDRCIALNFLVNFFLSRGWVCGACPSTDSANTSG